MKEVVVVQPVSMRPNPETGSRTKTTDGAHTDGVQPNAL
jgi:hypothetical protein